MNVNWEKAEQGIIALLVGLIPAFVAYLMVTVATFAESPPAWVFYVGVPVFGYILYQETSTRGKIGSMFFWLAIETLLTPLMFVLYTFAFSSQQAMTGAGQAGAAIGGAILAAGGFVIGIPLAGVFYLLSRKISPTSAE